MSSVYIKNIELSLAFTIMWKNEISTDVYLSKDRKHVHIEKYTVVPGRQPFMGGKIDTPRIYEFLKSRCYEDGYVGLTEILRAANLTYNDPWKWCEYSNGVTWDDYLWIKYPKNKNLRWEDVRCR